MTAAILIAAPPHWNLALLGIGYSACLYTQVSYPTRIHRTVTASLKSGSILTKPAEDKLRKSEEKSAIRYTLPGMR